jgi:two-component system alkaline phosphatase synthesis response regulator PhoP
MISTGKSSYTVLIVDDDPNLIELLTDGLELLGHFEVISAEDGIQGLERYFEVRPDCMVIDVMMPGLDGYQLVKALRGDPDSADTPLVMLTAMAQDKNRFAGLASGADQYLIKPVTPRQLVEAVHQAIAIGEAERQERLLALVQEVADVAADE